MTGDTTGVYMPIIYMRMCERNANIALLLSQILYWHTPDKDGNARIKYVYNGRRWLIKQYADFEQELEIGIPTLKRAMKWIEEKGWIETQVKHSPFHNGQSALWITMVWPVFHAALADSSPKMLILPVKDQNDLSRSSNLSFPYTETVSESKDKDIAPKPARYDYLKSGSKFDRNSTAGTDSDEKAKVGLEALAPVDLDVVNLVVKHNPKAKKELSAKQVELLRASVATLKGEKPSPYDMAVGYPALWKRFVENIEGIPAWKKRVVENRERVTPGLVIAFFRGYEWQGGLLSYFEDRPVPPPSATDFYEDT